MRILGLCLLFAAIAVPARAQSPTDPSPNDYAGRWPLQLPDGAAAGAFQPGDEVHALLEDPAFGDLQVFDASGTPMPMARTPGNAEPRWVAARFTSAGPADGAAGDAGVMAYVYRLPVDVPVSAARIGFGSSVATVALQYQADGRWQAAARVPAPVAAAGEGEAAAPAPGGEASLAAPVTAHAWRIISGRALSPSPSLHLSIQPARFVFLAQGTPPYMVAAGHPVLRRAPAPIEAELVRLRSANGASWQPADAIPGARSTAPFVAAVVPVQAGFDWRRWLPWAAGGAGLLLASWQVLRRRPGPRKA